jgi:septal ring factor EnvC (AmiA/AmiB activator)
MRIKNFNMVRKIVFLLLLSSFTCGAFAQTKQELQQKQQSLLNEIGNLNKTLKEIRNSKSKSLANYNLVKRKIAAREELIQNINKDIRIIDKNIKTSQLEIDHLKKVLDTLKQEYAKNLQFAYKNRNTYNYLSFIFSASTFNDAIKRITYLKSYRQYREQQVAQIENTQQVISDKIASLNNSKNEKSMALQDQGKQLKVLEEDRKEKNEVVNKLKGQEEDLATQVKRRERDRQQIQQAITAAIRREQAEARKRAQAIAKQKAAEKAAADEKKKRDAEIARQNKANEAARDNAKANTNNTPKDNPKPAIEDVAVAPPPAKPKKEREDSPLESTDESKALSINFESSKGRLPWPVDAGQVTVPFGTYTIPGTKLVGRSEGITISLPVGAPVKAVADGSVTSIFDLGGEQAVIVLHGKYLTTYSHLSSTNVNKGQQVRPGTVLGRAATNDDGDGGEILFMVSNERGAPLNPTSWLRPR